MNSYTANRSNGSAASWLYQRGSPQSHSPQTQHNSIHNQSESLWSNSSFHNNSSLNQSSAGGASGNGSFASPYKNFNKKEIITEEHELQKYMR